MGGYWLRTGNVFSYPVYIAVVSYCAKLGTSSSYRGGTTAQRVKSIFHNNISWTLVRNWCHLSRKWLHSIFSEFPLRKIQHLFVTTKTDRFFSFLSWVKRPRDITPLLASVFCYAQVVRLTVSVLLTIPFILTVTSGYFRRLRKTSILFVTTGIRKKDALIQNQTYHSVTVLTFHCFFFLSIGEEKLAN